jgi:hypothetical protein
MKSNVSSSDRSEFHVVGNEFGESSEDTSSYFETSSSTLNNEKLYEASTPEQFMATAKTTAQTTTANSRLRSRMKLQQEDVRTSRRHFNSN